MPSSTDNSPGPFGSSKEILPQDCLQRLGIRLQPFSSHAPLKFVYADAMTGMTVGVLLENLNSGTQTLVLKGEPQSGKTTQIRRLLQSGHEKHQFCVLYGSRALSLIDILEGAKQQWRLPFGDYHKPEDLLRYFRLVLEACPSPVLVVDDAHLLNEFVLEALLTLKHATAQDSDPRQLGLVFCGEPSLERKLASVDARGKAVVDTCSVHLHPLNPEQTRQYLLHRMRVAGLTGDSPLGEDVVASIHRESGGIPGRINQLALSALRQACGEQYMPTGRHPMRRPGLRRMLAGGALASLALAIGLAVFAGRESIDAAHTRSRLVRPLALPAEAAPPPAATVSEGTASRGATDLTTTVWHEPSASGAPEPTHTALSIPLEPQPPAATHAATQPVRTGTLHPPSWLSEQPPGQYIVQLLATPSLPALKEFASGLAPDSQLAYLLVSREGRSWYVLLAGPYPDRATATAVIERLPAPVRQNRPWTRRVAELQSVVARGPENH